MRTPSVSIVVVSDYGSAGGRTWNDERACLDALAAQNFAEPFEIILSEDERYRDSVPVDLLERAPRVRMLFTAASTSYALKNAGARAAAASIVALLDADCRPAPDWVSLLMHAFRTREDISVVSGRTFYEGDAITHRVLCLLARSYLDPGREGVTSFASNNAVGFRREVILSHPLPEDLGPFAARVQSEAIRRAGGILWFEPRMRVVHEFEGLAMEADIRRNIGYGTVATRLSVPWMPYSRMVRLGILATPLIAAGKLVNGWRDCIRCAAAYRVRPLEVPVALAAMVAVQAMEVPGMIDAYRGRPVPRTAYR